MRKRLVTVAAALLLASRPGFAQASQQTPPPAAPAAAAETPLSGTVDVGGQFTTTDGDEARFERYRDSRSGLYSTFRLNKETASSLFSAEAFHVGYRDQRYAASFVGPKLNATFNFTGIPLNYSYITRTPYTTNGTTLTLPDSIQAAVQGPTNATNDGTAVGVPCAPGAPPAACSTPAQLAQVKAFGTSYNAVAKQFDLEHLRNNTNVGLTYSISRAFDVDANYQASMRSGTQPWGASFAFNNAIELPKPLDERTDDVTLGLSWSNPKSTFRVGWDGSWFTNHLHDLVWDNPIRISDFSNGLVPPLGPYDPSGYSNGNGPALGRMALAPDNMMNVVSATGLYKLATRTTVNGTVQVSQQKQNDTLIPWTINSLIATPLVYAAFPHISALPRTTAEAEAMGLNTLLNLSSRVARNVNVTVRYRYNKRDVQTPIFDATEYVRFDAVPEEVEEGHSPQFDNSRQNFDANLSFTPTGWGSIRVGYGHEGITREGRGFADVGEHIFRLSYDAFSSRWVTVRASFDTGRRRGEGFVEAESGNDEPSTITGPGGTQPTLRYYDEADRDRVRGTLLFTVMPTDSTDVYFQFTGGRDNYLADNSAPVSRPGELFGLESQKTTSWNVGANYRPTDVVAMGLNFGQDTFGSFQKSRNANPPPDPTWVDPSRDWTLDNDDNVKNASAYLDLLRAIAKTDIRLGYDYSDSDNSFVHGGPRIAALAAAGQFIPLPNVTNKWQRLSADVQYYFVPKVGVGVGYYFEKLDVTDWNTIDTNGPVGFTDATGVPRIDWLGGLITGYGNRPYTGNTGYVRLLYKF
jgi:MtrB/PioB family decaheme-associated outer membrane protein